MGGGKIGAGLHTAAERKTLAKENKGQSEQLAERPNNQRERE
jgi:hypothetical protein